MNFKVAIVGTAPDSRDAERAIINAVQDALRGLHTLGIIPSHMLTQVGVDARVSVHQIWPRERELTLCDPELFVCAKCGGRMMPETVGMLSGIRWLHSCGEERVGNGP